MDMASRALFPKPPNSARRIVGVAASILFTVGSHSGQASAEQPHFTDFPAVIYCEYAGITSAYYFSQLHDGQAIYLTPDRQAGMITIDGVAQRVGGDRPGSCQDKTLNELRSAGQAFDLPR